MEKLYLGTAVADITPEIGGNLYGYDQTTYSESVHDRLSATAFRFRCGETESLIFGLTVCLLNTELANEMRTLIAEKTGIPYGNIMLCATHTHSGPNVSGEVGWGDIDRPYYEQIFKPALLDAAEKAGAQMVSVKMGIGQGESLIGINRRQMYPNGAIGLGQCPWGAFDPKMTVLSFCDEAGKNVANLIHYGCHGTTAGKNHEISRDWSGIMIDRVQALFGGVTMFITGPEGDVGPRLSNGCTTGNIQYTEEHGGWAAQDAVRIMRTVKAYAPVEMDAKGMTVQLPVRKRMTMAEAEAQAAEFAGQTVNLGGLKACAAQRVIDSYSNGYEEIAFRTVPQTLIRLGDVVLAAFPFELFSEIGLRINQDSKVPYVLSVACCNGSDGYFPTEDQLCRGGYEVEMLKAAFIQPYSEKADTAYVQETVKNTEEIYHVSNR